MRTLLTLALLALVPTSTFADGEDTTYAAKLGAIHGGVRLESVETMESAPLQFAVVLEVSMPEPMWTLVVDSVATPDASGRLLIKLTGTRPEDVALPQVITPTPIRVALGSLPVGDYLLDVFLKRDTRAHARVGTVMLRATE